MSFKSRPFYYMLRTCFLLVFICSFLSIQAQVQQVQRYEIEQRNSDEDFTIIPLKEDGLALFRKKTKFADRSRIWELILLDSTLTSQKTIELAINNNGELKGYEHSHGSVHFMFVKNEVRGDMEVISIDLKTHDTKRTQITTELKLNLTHFNKCGDNFILGGHVGEESAVFVYVPSINNFKVIPGFFKKRTELVDVRINENKTFNTVLISRENRDKSKIIFRTFDSFGKQLLEDVIAFDGRNIQTGISSNLKRDDLMILGTWGNVGSIQSSGFYSVPVNPFTDQKVEFTYLGELSHYLDYMKPRRAQRIKAKTKRAIDQGSYLEFANYIIPHSIFEHKKGFLLLAETYLPTRDTYSRYNNAYGYGYGGGYNYGSPINGYSPYYPGSGMYNMNDARYVRSYGDNMNDRPEIRTIQSQVLFFDSEGKIVSDFSLDLNDFKIPSLNQIADVYLDDNSLYFLYKKESELLIKQINLQNGEAVDSTQAIKMKNPTDVIRHESKDGRIRYWFGKSFYMYGYQTVRAEGKNQEVFYINRVTID